MSASPGLADHAAVEGTFLLAASAETRTALAPIGDAHTAFTGALLETLRNGILGGPPVLDLETVYHHLRLTLEARGHPVPQARNRNSGARVALVRNHADLLAVGPVPAGGDSEPAHRLWPDPTSIRTSRAFHVPRGCAGGKWTDPAGGQPPLRRTPLRGNHQQIGQPRYASRHVGAPQPPTCQPAAFLTTRFTSGTARGRNCAATQPRSSRRVPESPARQCCGREGMASAFRLLARPWSLTRVGRSRSSGGWGRGGFCALSEPFPTRVFPPGDGHDADHQDRARGWLLPPARGRGRPHIVGCPVVPLALLGIPERTARRVAKHAQAFIDEQGRAKCGPLRPVPTQR